MMNIQHYKQHITRVSIFLLVLFFTAAFTVYKISGAVVTTADWLRAKKERVVACGYTKSTVTSRITYTVSENGSFNKGDIGPIGRRGGLEAMNDERPSSNNDGTGCSHFPGVATLLCSFTGLNRRINKVRNCS